MRSAHSLALVTSLAVFSSASGQIQFQDQTSTRFPNPLLNEYTNQATIGDIDNDGDLDIVLANGQGFGSQGAALRARVFMNNGEGNFTEESTTRLVSWVGWARGVELGDCDRDGDLDMVLAQDFNKQPIIFINQGPANLGVFANETHDRLPLVTLSSSRAQFGDVDNDGDLDLAFCHSGAVNRFGSGQPRMYINDGTGVYTDETATRFPAGLVPDQQDLIFGDIDNDLDLDIHLTSRASQSKLWINNGSGVFTALAGFPGGTNAYSYDFGDMDDDGDLDLLGVNGGSEILLRNNNPTPAWTNISAEISPNTAIDDNDSKFFDYDNDGDMDFIVGSLGAVERIYRNNGIVGTADFTQVTGLITTVGDSTMDIEVADLTGDGKLDVLTLQGESGSFIDRLYVNIGGAGLIDLNPPDVVSTEQVPDATSLSEPFVVRAIIYDDYTSDRGFLDRGVTLHAVIDGNEELIPMEWHGNSMWRGDIPPPKGGQTIEYWVSAIDWNNNEGVGPTLSFDIIVTPCPADIGGDGTVNVDDLLEVINAWGATSGPADINGSGLVDVDDLLAVINAWGDCP